MKLPSLQIVLQQTQNVLRLYPLEIITVIFGSIVAMLMTSEPPLSYHDQLEKLLMISLLALPSFIAVTLSARYGNWTLTKKIIFYGLIIAGLLVFFVSMDKQVSELVVIRFVVLNIAAHLAVASAPFIGRGTTHGFWQYNKALFLRIVTSAIFSGVLFAGLTGAFIAVKELFNLNISEIWPARIFILVAGLFNTIFFLNGVPIEENIPEEDNDYPKVLRVFTQYVLVPLVFIYFAILLIYEARIIINWELPNGWVSNLIIAFGIVGILSILLVYPIRNNTENKWISAFAKSFYLLILPLVLLMFVAVGKRISDYGFTEERIFVLATAIWLGGIAVYYLLKPHADIRYIPISLGILAIILSITAFKISEISQQNRLRYLLSKNNLLQNGKAIKHQGTEVIPAKDGQSIASIIRYLSRMHGIDGLKPMIENKALKEGQDNSYANGSLILDSLNYAKWANEAWGDYYVLLRSNRAALPVAGYDSIVVIEQNSNPVLTGLKAVIINQRLRIYLNEEQISPDINPGENIVSLAQLNKNNFKEALPAESLKQVVETPNYRFLIYYNNISFNFSKGQNNYSELPEGFVLVKKK